LKIFAGGQQCADGSVGFPCRKDSEVHVPLALVAAFGGFAASALVVALVALLMLGPSALGERVSE
jgi:hypothetical protein